MKYIYPKNKEKFKRLIPFAKRIIKLCKNNGIRPVIYGSFSHFYHTRDTGMKVNDIDILIPKKSFPKAVELLKKEKINFKYYPEQPGIALRKGDLKIEIDDIGEGYRTLKEVSYNRKNVFDKIDFYGMEVEMITLGHLEEIYPVAYKRSRDDKERILVKLKHLEKYLRRKLR